MPGIRRSARVPARKAVLLIVESEQCGARTLDVSQHGVRVECQTLLKPGQVLELLPSENSGGPIRCVVVWAGDVGSDREGEAGLNFLTPQPSLV
jgi:hypothetical protein